jgi:hypothetical protein
MKRSNTRQILLFSLAWIVALGIPAASAWSMVLARRAPATSKARSPAREPPPTLAVSAPEPPKATLPLQSSTKPATRAIVTGDPSRVDLVDMLAQAHAFALELQPGAQLVEISAHAIPQGAADLKSSDLGGVAFGFEYRGRDPSRAQGRDRVSRSIRIFVRGAELWANVMALPTYYLDANGVGLETPTCGSQRAFHAAFGASSNELATMTLVARPVASRERRLAWQVRAGNVSRYVDARTCAAIETRSAARVAEPAPRKRPSCARSSCRARPGAGRGVL